MVDSSALSAPSPHPWRTSSTATAPIALVERAVEALLRGGPRGYASLLGSDLPALERSCPEGHEVARLFLSDWSASAGSARGREAARRFDLARWLPNTYLEKTDRATMAAGVEARTPFLDPAIAASLEDPALQFGKAGLRRLLVRTAAGRCGFPTGRRAWPSPSVGCSLPVSTKTFAAASSPATR